MELIKMNKNKPLLFISNYIKIRYVGDCKKDETTYRRRVDENCKIGK